MNKKTANKQSRREKSQSPSPPSFIGRIRGKDVDLNKDEANEMLSKLPSVKGNINVSVNNDGNDETKEKDSTSDNEFKLERVDLLNEIDFRQLQLTMNLLKKELPFDVITKVITRYGTADNQNGEKYFREYYKQRLRYKEHDGLCDYYIRFKEKHLKQTFSKLSMNDINALLNVVNEHEDDSYEKYFMSLILGLNQFDEFIFVENDKNDNNDSNDRDDPNENFNISVKSIQFNNDKNSVKNNNVELNMELLGQCAVIIDTSIKDANVNFTILDSFTINKNECKSNSIYFWCQFLLCLIQLRDEVLEPCPLIISRSRSRTPSLSVSVSTGSRSISSSGHGGVCDASRNVYRLVALLLHKINFSNVGDKQNSYGAKKYLIISTLILYVLQDAVVKHGEQNENCADNQEAVQLLKLKQIQARKCFELIKLQQRAKYNKSPQRKA